MLFTQFQPTDVVTGKITRVSSPLWPGSNVGAPQSSFSTNPTQVVATGDDKYDLKNGLYYTDVYYAAEPFFSVAFGNAYGDGNSEVDEATVHAYPTKVIYSQYKNILLQSTQQSFTFLTASSSTTTTSITSSNIYVLAFSVNQYKDRIDEGHIQFSLSGSNGLFTFIDDYTLTNTVNDSYNIISGSIVNGVASAYSNGQYNAIGNLYPKAGIIVLNADKLGTVVGSELLGNRNNTGAYKLNQQLILSSITNCVNSYFTVRKSEYLPSKQYFIRVKNQEYNYSNNPTFVTGSNGKIRFTEFYTNPQTYITTVGLYNENNDLVAVAKTSQPIMKSFDTEALIKIKLDF